MSSRKAACEPCRKSKLACDHGRPACSRCTCQGRAGSCTYRASPFKRKQPVDNESPEWQRDPPYHRSRRPTQPTGTKHPYPNPGYLGRSSHVAIFDQLFYNGGVSSSYNPSPNSGRCLTIDDFPQAKQGAECLKQLLSSCNLDDMKSLVSCWRAKGANLALAGPLVELCAESASCTSLSSLQGEDWHVGLAQRLIENTARPLEYDATTSFASYSAQFVQSQTRWETLGLFLCAVLRATMDVPFFPSLFTTATRRREFRAMLMRQIGCFLDVCISMDCLNDLQLFFQYEYFIIHSYMNGDHSYHLWRSLGDVISSISALGYHERLDAKPDTPKFLIQLRKTAFARVYSADKNLALFFGRPLRMSKRFYHLHLPDTRPSTLSEMPQTDDALGPREWHTDSDVGYWSETRWSAICASINEETMELLFDRSRGDCSSKVSELQKVAEEQWSALPECFRMVDGSSDRIITPFERDFLISLKLNHLHVMFLLQRLLLGRMSEPDGPLIEIAQQMLALVVEAILKRDDLANSGTNLNWKIAHYGLPATGMILLAITGQNVIPCLRMSRAKVLRNLTILSAEIEQGTIVKPEDPNYAVLAQAAQTIQRFLDLIHSEGDRLRDGTEPSLSNHVDDDYTWAASLGPEIWDSEISFWQGLAEHPSPFAQYSMPPN